MNAGAPTEGPDGLIWCVANALRLGDLPLDLAVAWGRDGHAAWRACRHAGVQLELLHHAGTVDASGARRLGRELLVRLRAAHPVGDEYWGKIARHVLTAVEYDLDPRDYWTRFIALCADYIGYGRNRSVYAAHEVFTAYIRGTFPAPTLEQLVRSR